MNEWIIAFIPLWIVGFMVGFFARKINKWLDEPKAFVLRQGIEITTPQELAELLFHQKK